MIEYDFDNLNIKLIQYRHKLRKFTEELKEFNNELERLIKLGGHCTNTKTDKKPSGDGKE